LFELPGGQAGFAVGAEFRDHDGFFRADPIAESGETAGIPSGSTEGEFDVTEFYAEVSLPLVEGAPLADYLELNLAGRASDYSTFGSETTWKASALWRPVDELSLRASYSTGPRATGIGVRVGGAVLEDITYRDPIACWMGQ